MPGMVPRLSPRRYDAVIKSLNGRLMLPLTWSASRARGLPFVLWTGMWYHPQSRFHRLSRPLTEAIYRQAGAIVGYGEHVRRFVLRTPGVAPTKVFVAGQAVEPETFAAVPPANGDSNRVLFVGQLKHAKGIADLLAAWAGIDEPEATLRVVGMQLVGYMPQARLPAELANARCLVLPSITTAVDREPWGLVVNEAMHAGRPVVVSDAVGAAAGGLVRQGENGLIVPEQQPNALRDALEALLSDRERVRQMGEQARSDAARFTHERMAAAFEQAVAHAVQSSG
jgi:glycosyltransferase involved in cell wall biosynthesis